MIRDVRRLRAALGRPELEWLLERSRQRLEQGRPITGIVTLGAPSSAQREAIDGLLGRCASRGQALSVRLSDVEEVLRRAEICDSLYDAVESLAGPIRDRRGEDAARRAGWKGLYDAAESQIGKRDELRKWLADVRCDGLLGRLCGGDIDKARGLLDCALAVARRLPGNAIPLSELAASCAGNSHALDTGAPLATLVLRAAARIGGAGEGQGAEARRDSWARVGVLCDELSAPVLVLNLRASETSPTGRALRIHADAGEPYRLSLRQLLRDGPRFEGSAAMHNVRVCENPTVVAAAAARLGPRSGPLVCVEGQPKTAAHALLRMLTAAGVRLAYHGDFDWAGIRIGNLLRARHNVVPWRFGVGDYSLAANGGGPLHGAPVVSSWDANLAAAMTEAGRAVHEEQVLDLLLEDLEASEDSAVTPLDEQSLLTSGPG